MPNDLCYCGRPYCREAVTATSSILIIIALKSSGGPSSEAQKKSLIISKSRGHAGVIISLRGQIIEFVRVQNFNKTVLETVANV